MKDEKIKSTYDSKKNLYDENWLFLFILSLFGIVPLTVLYSIFREMGSKKIPSIFNYRLEMLLLILMPILIYLRLLDIDDRQAFSAIVAAPFLGFILTVLFIIYLEFVNRSVKVKFSIFLILSWACAVLTWLFYPRGGLGF
ncbi:hypothetical protein [Leptospira weilii]|uniref:hypothetical protein n=1 Tax=Leptospira weilii TaxID=28184 RepID=UPI001EF1B104|nr:hypothetical protein [Leptospira weilii]ULH28698.1 hypothetical protein FH586_20835 [Leptospira weilii]